MKILFITLVSINLIVSLYNWGAYAYYFKDSKVNIGLQEDMNKEDAKTSEVEKAKSITELTTKSELWETSAGEWRLKSIVDLLILISAVFTFYKPLKRFGPKSLIKA
jgi:hypothetical protein